MILTMTASTPTLTKTPTSQKCPNPQLSQHHPPTQKKHSLPPPQSELKQKSTPDNRSSAQTNLNDHLCESDNEVDTEKETTEGTNNTKTNQAHQSESDTDVDTEKAAIEAANKTQQQANEQLGELPIGNE